MDDKIDRMIDDTAMQFLLVQNRQQTHEWTMIGSGSNGIAYKCGLIPKIEIIPAGNDQHGISKRNQINPLISLKRRSMIDPEIHEEKFKL